MNLIGLIGKAGSGKTYAAEHLVENHGFKRLSFAEPIKKIAAAITLTEEQIYGSEKEEPIDWLGGVTSRWIQQTIGTEWGREMIDEDIWVKITQQKIKKFELMESAGYDVNIVIDDVRFANEVKMVRWMGGKVIKIRAETNIKAASPSAQHASEKVMGLGCDVTIENHFDDTFIPSLMRQL